MANSTWRLGSVTVVRRGMGGKCPQISALPPNVTWNTNSKHRQNRSVLSRLKFAKMCFRLELRPRPLSRGGEEPPTIHTIPHLWTSILDSPRTLLPIPLSQLGDIPHTYFTPSHLWRLNSRGKGTAAGYGSSSTVSESRQRHNVNGRQCITSFIKLTIIQGV